MLAIPFKLRLWRLIVYYSLSISFDTNNIISKYTFISASNSNLWWTIDMRVFVLVFSLLNVVATQCAAITFDEVKRLQSQLNYLGFDAGSVDGRYGKRTETALQNLFEKIILNFTILSHSRVFGWWTKNSWAWGTT